MDLLKEINPQLVITQIICFFLILGLLRWKLWGPVFKVLEERRKKIADDLKAIEDLKAEVAAVKADYAGHINRIDQIAQERLREIERQGEEKTRQMREEARRDADQVIEGARQEIRFEMVKAKQEIKEDVVGMVVTLTEKMIEEKLTFDQDKKIIEHMLEEMDKPHEK